MKKRIKLSMYVHIGHNLFTKMLGWFHIQMYSDRDGTIYVKMKRWPFGKRLLIMNVNCSKEPLSDKYMHMVHAWYINKNCKLPPCLVV